MVIHHNTPKRTHDKDNKSPPKISHKKLPNVFISYKSPFYEDILA
ncbi:hypothetical protein SDC9_171938 [bioreactor metagenome]|uniref:Uncharacterized protein n=1 Tax=bioreactor metagenome TaxID=1076179 RepID=A0A645GFH5_9ZZZZ